MVFDGVDGRADRNLDAKVMGGPMTIVGVIKWNAFQTSSRLFDCGNGPDSDNIIIRNQGGTQGVLDFTIFQGNTSKYARSLSTSDLVVGVWYHIVASVSDTTMISYNEEDEEEEAPEGWTIMFSEEHNANYYRNIRTKKKVWDRPEAEKKRRKKTRGWSTVSQGAKSAPYFVNDHTGESTWDPPTLPAAPEGWSVHAHGEHHYFQDDAGGGATQWHHPHDDAPPGVV